MQRSAETMLTMGLADRDYMRWPYWRAGDIDASALEAPVRDVAQHRRWRRARRESRALRVVNWIVVVAVATSLVMTIREIWPKDTTWGHVADWIGMHLP